MNTEIGPGPISIQQIYFYYLCIILAFSPLTPPPSRKLPASWWEEVADLPLLLAFSFRHVAQETRPRVGLIASAALLPRSGGLVACGPARPGPREANLVLVTERTYLAALGHRENHNANGLANLHAGDATKLFQEMLQRNIALIHRTIGAYDANSILCIYIVYDI